LWDGSGRTAILAEYPAETRHQIPRDLEVHDWMSKVGVRVAAVLDHDAAAGWILLEDFGPDDGETVLRRAQAADVPALVSRTLEPLAILSRQTPHRLPPWNPPLDRHRLRWELAGFELWFVRHHRGVSPTAALGAWLDSLADEVSSHPQRICHRDFHLNNLFFLPSGEVGVIDAQDVLVGPDTYDGVSLMSERATPTLFTPEQLVAWQRQWARCSRAHEGWEQRWRRVRLQRGLKVLGTFARLTLGRRGEYHLWMATLARDLTAAATELELPDELIGLLID
jgi:aminoglycoside/choline kinase family phosphotransferase